MPAKGKYDPNMLTVVEYMAKQGCLDKQIYAKLDISYQTFYKWLKTNSEFAEAYKRGKDNTDDLLCLEAESSLMKLAKGYEYEQTTTKQIPGGIDPDTGKSKPEIREKIIKTVKVGANLGACCYILNNRNPARWSNREHSINNGDIAAGGLSFSKIARLINPAFYGLLTYYDKSIILMRGGAGSGKSVASAKMIVLSLIDARNQLVVRKVAKTLRTSVFTEVKKAIDELEVNDLFKIHDTSMLITCLANDCEAHFVGCDNVQKLKSITPSKGMFDDIHIEEMTEISLSDFEVLTTRQRGESNTPRRIFGRFNPIFDTHWIKTEIYDSGKYDFLDHHTTYKDNIFLSQIDKDKYEAYKEKSPYLYQVYALGQWGVLGGLIFPDFTEVDTKPGQLAGINPLYGQDFGYENPAATVRVYLCNKQKILYIDDEIVESKLSNADLANLLRPFLKDDFVICDSAEPKTIEELRGYGIKAIAADKGPGSVLSGIKFINSFQIFINRRCVETLKEFKTYQRKLDKQGKTTEQPLKENDHCIDAIRYAIERQIKQSTGNLSK
jgi:phage terminase large subunit